MRAPKWNQSKVFLQLLITSCVCCHETGRENMFWSFLCDTILTLPAHKNKRKVQESEWRGEEVKCDLGRPRLDWTGSEGFPQNLRRATVCLCAISCTGNSQWRAPTLDNDNNEGCDSWMLRPLSVLLKWQVIPMSPPRTHTHTHTPTSCVTVAGVSGKNRRYWTAALKQQTTLILNLQEWRFSFTMTH